MSRSETPSRYSRVSGSSPWKALGYTNERAFQRARQSNSIALTLYPMPGQARGVYARSDDLAAYLAAVHAPP